MIATVFHLIAFAALAVGLVLSAFLFTALALVVAAGVPRSSRQRSRPRHARVPVRVARFDLAH